MDPAGSAYVTGLTMSTDFPTRRARQAHPGSEAGRLYLDGFVAKYR